VAFAPDGRTVASAGSDAVLRIWDVAGQKLQAEKKIPPGGPVQALVYAPDGHTLASAGLDGHIILWEPATAEPQHEWKLPGEVRSLAFHPNSRLLAAGNENGTIYLLRLRDKNQEVVPK
jgi:WD40 repeat protein